LAATVMRFARKRPQPTLAVNNQPPHKLSR